jgi:O-antigen biosynthesis protein
MQSDRQDTALERHRDRLVSVDQPFEKNEGYYHGVRTDLLRLAPQIQGRVLEIGCAEGLTMEYLRSRFNCTLVGLDCCESALVKAREKGFEVHTCDLNREALPFAEQEFDYILIGDVLEHLYDPWSVLTGIARILKDDGTILISIPNVKHYTLLKDLILHDSWDYCESGLLDITHVRFFTFEGIRKLLSRSGLVISDVAHNVSGSRLMRVVNALCFNRLHSFLVFHYLIAARKSTSG